jgi:hypothetical protein
MRRISEQMLSSSYYAAQADGDGMHCVCCGVLYPGTGTHCNRCQAPLELSRTVKARRTPPRFISVLGASGAGKTVYLGLLLDILSRGCGELRGLSHGSYSIAVQENIVSALQNRRFPGKTATEGDSWHWLHCEVTTAKHPNRPWDVITPDIAGEALSLEVDQPKSFPAIWSVVSQAAGVMLMCDAIAATESPLGEDVFALKLLSYIHSACEVPGKSRKQSYCRNLPVAIVLTKCDQCPEVQRDPENFVTHHLPRLLQYCRKGFQRFQFFAASAVADCVTLVDDYGCASQIPLHVEPKGIIEPLQWIMKQK